MIKVFPRLLALICSAFLPSIGLAFDSSVWLSNLKSEVIRLGINERSYLHSVGRMRNSIMRSEDLFFVSAIDLEELDIRFLANGEVQVSKQLIQPYSRSPGSLTKNFNTGTESGCSSFIGKPPRVSLVVEESPIGGRTLTSRERNLKHHVSSLVKQRLSDTDLVKWSPENSNVSHYENLVRGNAWSQPRYRVSANVNYESTARGKISLVSANNPRTGFREPSNNSHISVNVELTEHGIPLETLKETVSLGQILPVSSLNIGANFNKSSRTELNNLVLRLNEFVADLTCYIHHSNLVVFTDGKLILDAGFDAGFYEGDELLMLPKESYLKKRGLLPGVDRLAIARIIKIDKYKSELEIQEGNVQIENGVEFSVRPLLDLI